MKLSPATKTPAPPAPAPQGQASPAPQADHQQEQGGHRESQQGLFFLLNKNIHIQLTVLQYTKRCAMYTNIF